MIDTQTWVQKLRAGDRCRAPQAASEAFLEDVLAFVARYARVERLVLGSVDVTYSPSSLQVNLAVGGEPGAQGEALAEAERSRLALPAGPIVELQWLIEAQGIKVVPCLFPAPEYAGGFFFDSQLGPCILLHAGASESEKLYALAHQYAHFLADYDPYVTTLCALPRTATPDEPSEARAHATALALLMPRADLQTYREALGHGRPAPVSAQLLEHLHVYFDLDPEIVLWRLLALQWIDAVGLRTLLAANPALAAGLRTPPPVVPTDRLLLPGRFVRLVASAFGSGRIDLEGAADYLGTDSDGAERILEQFEYEDRNDEGTALEPRIAQTIRQPRRAQGIGAVPESQRRRSLPGRKAASRHRRSPD